MSVKAILFDHDGTLVDSEPIHFRIWRQVLADYGVDLSEQEYTEQCAGVPTRTSARDVVARYSIDETPEALVRRKALALGELLARQAYPLMPGALQIIHRFHSLGLRLAIVTGSGRAEVSATARSYSLHPMFETIVSGDDVERNKPHPDGYQLAMRRLGVSPQECLAIEDTEHGLKAAADAGIACLAVPNAMSMHHDFSRALGTFGGLAEIERWVEGNWLHQQ